MLGEDTSQLLDVSRKSATALRTIGEVAEELDLPQHVLRFWEKRFNQVMPVKRRGRRYYRPEDIAALQEIKTLLHQGGLTIKGVQRYLQQRELLADNSQPDLFGKAQAAERKIAPVVTPVRSANIKPALSKGDIALLQLAISRINRIKAKLDSFI